MLHRHIVEKDLNFVFDNYHYGSTVYSPLYNGILTGKYNDMGKCPENSRFAATKVPLMVEKFNSLFEEKSREKTLKTLNGLSQIS